MRQRGVSVRPIRSIAGDHEVNEVFLDEVIVPQADRVGEEGAGWSIAKFLLENERGGSCHAPRLLADLGKLRELAGAEPASHGGALIEEPAFAARLARLELEAQALEITELRIVARIAAGKPAGPQTSLTKLVASTLHQEIDALAVRLFGYAGLQLPQFRPLYAPECPEPVHSAAAQVAAARYLNSRAWSIFGGSNEIQKTIIAKRVLGL
jgi:alkylation response protein AidB-like acyl-CoA dehydrogenase